MTRWGFVSDIHGNRAALERAVSCLSAAGAERFVCLGDVIGRGDPEACVAWVRDETTFAIVGNRDLDYLDRVSPELQEVVRTWPHEHAAADFLATHGDPRLHRRLNSAAERDGFSEARAYLVDRGARVWFFGHTHRPRIWELGPEVRLLDGVDSVTLCADLQYIVNVGTTGLPLPGRGGPSCVLYDDIAGTIQVIALSKEPGATTRRKGT